MAKHWRELNAVDLSYVWNALLDTSGGDNLRKAHHFRALLDDGWSATQLLSGIFAIRSSTASPHILALVNEPDVWMSDDVLICEGHLLEQAGYRLPDSYAVYCNNGREQGVPNARIANAADAAREELEEWLDDQFERIAADSRNILARIIPTKRAKATGGAAARRVSR